MVPEAGAWTEFVAKTPIGSHIDIDFAYETADLMRSFEKRVPATERIRGD